MDKWVVGEFRSGRDHIGRTTDAVRDDKRQSFNVVLYIHLHVTYSTYAVLLFSTRNEIKIHSLYVQSTYIPIYIHIDTSTEYTLHDSTCIPYVFFRMESAVLRTVLCTHI